MNSARQRGFTLVELIIFIVVVAAGLAGILTVMNTVVRSSADPLVRKQAIALADSILEEVLQKDFADPDGLPNLVEADRTLWDNVSDYAGQTNLTLGVPLALNAYVVGIAVVPDAAALGAIASLRVTVTVTRGAEVITMTGYRAAF